MWANIDRELKSGVTAMIEQPSHDYHEIEDSVVRIDEISTTTKINIDNEDSLSVYFGNFIGDDNVKVNAILKMHPQSGLLLALQMLTAISEYEKETGVSITPDSLSTNRPTPTRQRRFLYSDNANRMNKVGK